MSNETKILMLEDLVADSMLIERELRQASIKFVSKRVENKEAFLKALVTFQPDIILSDYSLPQFSGLDALRLLKEARPDLPFILITGSLTEEVAVECMKEGAHDYILKTSLKRLPSAVLNALAKRRTEQDKEKAEELYRLIAENTTDLICLLDTEGNYAYVSPSHKDLLGYAPEDLIGRSSFSIVHPDDQEEAHKFAVSLERNKGGTLECRLQHVDGSWKAFDVVGNWIFEGHDIPQRVILVSRDLSERKLAEKALRESEEQLRQAQKLEAIGQLAGGVAHDFNNLLTVITGYSDLLLKRIAEGDSNRSRVEEIKRAAERASSLTRQLLAFSRKQVLQPKLFDLNTLVADMGKMLQRLIGEDIDLTTVLTKDVAQINADPGQIEQVLMNLVVNARDAMSDGGKITIETAHVEIDQAYAESHLAVQPGPYVMLAVSDTGSGIDQETKKHIFEPFFTTKEQGKGTGLGLSTVYGIVKQSGGNIWIYSELGQGTTFKVYLPQAGDGVSLKGTQIEPGIIVKGTETVLLVEDEPQIRELAYEFLSDSGYKVLPSSNGNEALDILGQHLDGVHLIVTDVVMPQMSGRELAERAIAISPGTKVLFMSGYTNDAIVRHGVLNPGTWFIQKPFGPDALARKVREVLDAPSANKILVPDSGAHEQHAETVGRLSAKKPDA
ncbi:MAG TPA: response regulator [Pyrinomonadaceae bacterium]|nr:response regulator [Pyrinomonadaceae bacterium]